MSEPNEHQQKMQRRKDSFEERKARATREKGLIIVNTGAGKGKTTAALGLAFRALGQGLKVGIVQFIKGAIPTGEAALAAQFANRGAGIPACRSVGDEVDPADRNVCPTLPIEMHTMGDGFTWNTQDRDRDIASARRAWDKAVQLLRDESFGIVILDELNIVLKYDYLPLEEVLSELRNKREMLHVVITGRNAKDELIELADLVTEMKLIKHPYKEGVKPQPGVEF